MDSPPKTGGWRGLRFLALAALAGAAVLHPPKANAVYDPTTYVSTNPTFTVSYTAAQKSAQSTAGASMMTALVNAATSGQTSYTIAPGVYRVVGGSSTLNNISNFTIHCANVTIWLDVNSAGTSLQWLKLSNCQNVSIVGPVVFDSDSLQMIQGAVTAFSAANGTMDIQITPGYSTALPASQGIFWHYSPAGVNLTRPSYSAFTNYVAGDPTKARLTVGASYFTGGPGSLLHTGDLVLIRLNNVSTRSVVGLGSSDTNITLNGIASYHGPMWAGGECQGNFSQINCTNYREPGTNRLGGSDEPGIYTIASNYLLDGITCGPASDDGWDTFSGMVFDFAQTSPNTFVIESNLTVGDRIDFHDPVNWSPEGYGTVVSVTPLTDTTLQTQLINNFNAFRALYGRAWRFSATQPLWYVTLDTNLRIPDFSDATRASNQIQSFTARNCYLADFNVAVFVLRGIDTVDIENNVIERGRNEQIIVEPDYYWSEGPLPQNITIKNNTLNNSCDPYGQSLNNIFIASAVKVGSGVDGPGMPVSNVEIKGNTFNHSLVNPIKVRGCLNVDVSNNIFVTPEAQNANDFDNDQYLHCGIFVESCSNLNLSGNSLVSPSPYTTNLVQFGVGIAADTVTGNNAPPRAPTGLAVVAAGANQFNLTWTDNTGSETGYLVESKALGNADFAQIATLGANAKTYIDASVHQAGVVSYYRVRAINGALASAYSNTAVAWLPLSGGNGLNFDYYEGHWSTIPASFSGLVPARSAVTPGFNLSVAETGSYYMIAFHGQINIPTAGSYTFYTSSDDGCKLYVDGTLVVPEVDLGPEQSAAISLTAGSHAIRVEYLQGYGGSSLSVKWAGPGISKTAIPVSALTPDAPLVIPPTPPGSGSGLLGSYFNNTTVSGTPALTRMEAVDFNWGWSSPGTGVNQTNFSARWIGSVEAPVAGLYTFVATTDNGVRLWLDDVAGSPVIDEWSTPVATSYSYTLALTAGQRLPIRMEYCQITGTSQAQLHWYTSNQPDQPIPASRLYSVFEAENLGVTWTPAADTTRIVADSRYSNGQAVILDGQAVGDVIQFTVSGLGSASYDVRIGVKKAASRGIVQLAIGSPTITPANVGSPQDEYAASDTYGIEQDLGIWKPGSTSDKLFRFTITGKNASSSGYNFALDYIKLIPQ